MKRKNKYAGMRPSNKVVRRKNERMFLDHHMSLAHRLFARKLRFCPDDCAYLTCSEADQEIAYRQTGVRARHYCMLWHRQLCHGEFHPKLICVTGCVKEILFRKFTLEE